MIGYTSGKTHHDPEPFVRTYNGANELRLSEDLAGRQSARFENGFGEIVQTRHAPRPEYDNHNPILKSFRTMYEWDPLERRKMGAEAYLANVADMGIAMGLPIGYVDHARRVLSRLASIGGAS